MIILGLHGPAGIGKSAIAKKLADRNRTFKIDKRLYQFAHFIMKAPIRETMHSVFGLHPDYNETPAVKNKYHPDLGMTIRLCEIKTGDMLRATFGSDVLCNAALRKIQYAYALGSRSYGMGFVLESIRPEREVTFFREKAPKYFPGCKVIMVKIKGTGTVLDPVSQKSKTEEPLPDELFDIILENDFSKSIADLTAELISKI